MHRLLLLFLVTAIFFSCTHKDKPAMYSLEENCGISFENKVTESKDFNVFKYRNFYNGGGVATGDLNNDGLPEVFFTANEGSNKLFLNKGNFQFEDISAKAGFTDKKQWSTGVVFADVNADGWLDIYVCNAGNMFDSSLRRNQLFINNHNLTFTERAAEFGLDNSGYSTQASFFDYDLDGDLDCFIVNNSPIPVNTLNQSNMRDLPLHDLQIAEFLKGGGDHLYRNDNGHFKEVSKEAGIHGGLISLGLGVTVADVNTDGYPDVYVSNDFFERDYLYINQHNGTFKDELEQRIQHTSLSSMGADIQDINNDGLPDIFTTDMLPADDYRLKANTSFDHYDVVKIREANGFYHQFTQNALQVNDGTGSFMETAFYSNVAASDWSWGALMFDADNDGLQDIYVSNGIFRDVTDQDFIDFFANDVVQQMVMKGKKEEVTTITSKMPSNPIPNSMFHNTGKLKFVNESDNWGLSKPSFSNGASYADLDNDGDLDLVVNNVNQPAFVYRNKANEQLHNNFITISLQYQPANTFAIGSTVKVYNKKEVYTRELVPSRGFQSSVDYRMVVGLGNGSADSVTITWPNGMVSSISKPAVNQLLTVDYNKAVKRTGIAVAAEPAIVFEEQPAMFDKHTEDEYVDFYYERNVPFMLSRQGPKAAMGDVNGDGQEDIFIGGARQQASQLYLKNSNGYTKMNVPDFTTFSFQDITAAFFFDADKDGDLDLFAGGGGNFEPAATGSIQNQLYINDGKGNFTLKRGALSPNGNNCGTAFAFDFNNDGAMDIFAGGRSMAQDYGTDASCFIYQNDGAGNFRDVTKEVAPSLQKRGMFTGALWTDINGDRKNELLLCGEWMHPLVYSFDGKKFTEQSSGLESYDGFWQTISAADVDGDGDNDLLLGNMGDNFYLHPDSANPVKIWMYDFDQNGTSDKILSSSINGKDIPVFTKREITEQIPALKKLNLKHHDYAAKSVQQVFESDISKAVVKQVNYMHSAVAINDGKGHFVLHPLPDIVQLSSVNAFCMDDINGDGFTDMIACGNFYDLLPQFCRVDASKGVLLLNDKRGNFIPVKNALNIRGEVRDIQKIVTGKEKYFLFLLNNQSPLLYKLRTNSPS